MSVACDHCDREIVEGEEFLRLPTEDDTNWVIVCVDCTKELFHSVFRPN
jgi:hypothetical protein